MVRRRLKLLLVLLALPFAAILARLWSLQGDPVKRATLLAEGMRQHIVNLPIAPRRGGIVDRNGEVLAENLTRYDLYFIPNELDPRPRRGTLARIASELDEAGASVGFDLDSLERHFLAIVRRARIAGASRSESVPFIEDIPAAAASDLERVLGSNPAFGITEIGGRFTIEVHPAEALPLEDALDRIAALLPGTSPRDLEEAVARRDAEIENHLERRHGTEEDDEKRNERLLLRERTALLVSDISLDRATAIEYAHEELRGLEVVDATRRSYPYGELCGALVGYLRRLDKADHDRLEEENRILALEDFEDLESFARARKGVLHRDDLVGAIGLEARYDAELRGLYGARRLRRDREGHLTGVDVERLPPENGRTIETTLDIHLQKVLYEALARRARELGARGGSAAVMEISPALGAIRASVGYPSFDGNRIRETGYREEQNRRFGTDSAWELDRPLLQSIAPGSVFKIVTTVAGLESGLAYDGVRPTAAIAFPCEHGYRVGGRFLRCHSEVGHGVAGDINLIDGLKYSCNSCFYRLAHHHLTPEILYSWAWAFGYGRHPGLDVPPAPEQETGTGRLARGILIDPARPDRPYSEPTICAFAIGQEVVAATPLQVLRSFAAIAVRGKSLPVPWLVTPRDPEPLPRLRESTIDLVWDGMQEVARPGGTAGKVEYGLTRFSVALKTGTAQYTTKEKRWHSWIAGFGPLPHPRFAFVVVFERASAGGGEACAPVLETMLRQLAIECPELERGSS